MAQNFLCLKTLKIILQKTQLFGKKRKNRLIGQTWCKQNGIALLLAVAFVEHESHRILQRLGSHITLLALKVTSATVLTSSEVVVREEMPHTWLSSSSTPSVNWYILRSSLSGWLFSRTDFSCKSDFFIPRCTLENSLCTTLFMSKIEWMSASNL